MADGAIEAIHLNADLLNALPDGILVADREGRIVFCSRQLETISGYRSEELVGQPVEHLVPEACRRGHVGRRSSYFATGAPIRAMGSGLRIVLRAKDGAEIPVDISLSPLATEAGTVAVAAVRDATEHTRFEQELRDSREQLQLMINGVADYAIFMVDPGGHVVSWNSGAERIKGYAAAEVLGRHISLFYPPDAVRAGAPGRGLQTAADTGRFEEEGWRVRKDGQRFWANVVITAVHDETGKLRGFSKVTRDVTQRKRTQDRLAAIAEIGQAILAGGDYEHLLALICLRARQLMEAATAAIGMVDPGGDDLELVVVDGDGVESLRGLRVPAGGADGGAGGFEAAIAAAGLGTAITVPLLAGGRSLGALGLANPPGGEPFTPESQQMIQLFANQAAVAIEYDRAREELRRLDLIEERERIGRELHDGVIQALYGVGMNLQATALQAGSPEVAQRLDASVVEIDRAIRDLRNYIFGLRPGILADRQLAQAITQLATEAAGESGIAIVTDIDSRTAAALASQAADVVQLIRESLSNVARHARATTCRVSLHAEGSWALLEIDDDGQGFDTARDTGSGHGLRNLRDRAHSLGGDLDIQSGAADGTTIRIRLPI